MLQVSWHVSDAEAWTSGVHVVGAKWRREVPPPRRLTARELVLPWAHLSFPALAPGQPGGCRRWHPCCRRCLLKDCERWFLPLRPQARYCSAACREAAGHWRSWYAGQTYRATIQGKERRREQARRRRERQRQQSALAESAAPTLPIDPTLPVIEAQTTSDSIPIIPAGTQNVGQRQKIFAPNLTVCRAADPGATSCLCLRPVLPIDISVPAHAARPYGEFASAKPDSDAAAAVVPGLCVALEVAHPRPHQSCRHVLESAIPKTYFFIAPRTEEEAGGPGLPVPRFLARN